jgi:hypothetical protein
MELKINVQEVPIDSLKPNPWNPNKQTDFIFEKEKMSIKTHGFIDPILVREKDGDLEIIDGEHRFRAARSLGFEKISVNNLGEVSDPVAKQLTIIMNETRGRADADMMSKLLKDIEQSVGLDHMIEVLPYTPTEIEAFTAEASVDWNEISPSLSQSAPLETAGSDPTSNGQSSAGGPSIQQAPLKKILHFEVSEEIFESFNYALDKIKEKLHPDSDPSECAPDMALQAMSQIIVSVDLDVHIKD